MAVLQTVASVVVAIFLSTTAPGIYSQSMDYSDLQATGASCPSRHSCRGEVSSDFNSRNCECDRQCRLYGDCCIDATWPRLRRPQEFNFTCFPHEWGFRGAYVVDKCSTGWSGEESVRQNCETSNGGDLSDPVFWGPATDLNRRITFRNLYCAMCNNADVNGLEPWSAKISCDSLSRYNNSGNITSSYVERNLQYSQSDNGWGIYYPLHGASSFHKCDLAYSVPMYMENSVRFCRPNAISTCDRRWRRAQIKRRCVSYTAVVYTDNTAYRNPHCAICNNVADMNILKCEVGVAGRIRPTMSFTLLLDINRQTNSQRCPGGQKWDPFFNKCRELVCALPGFTMVNDRCVQQP